jgi:hypothetical protein
MAASPQVFERRVETAAGKQAQVDFSKGGADKPLKSSKLTGPTPHQFTTLRDGPT